MPRGPYKTYLSTAIRNSFGTGVLEKGRYPYWDNNYRGVDDGVYLIAWDFVGKCKYEECSLFKQCHYVKLEQMNREKQHHDRFTDNCLMQYRYLKSVLFGFIERMRKEKKVEQEDVLKFGYHMLPLYTQLFKFKQFEHSGESVLVFTSRGDAKINPIYKEIREVIKTITTVWKDIGGKESSKKLQEIGDAAYIDAMYTELEGNEDIDEATNTKQDLFSKGTKVNEDGTGLDIEGEVKTYKKKKRKKKKKKPGRPMKKKKPPVKAYLSGVVGRSPKKKEGEENAEGNIADVMEAEVIEGNAEGENKRKRKRRKE